MNSNTFSLDLGLFIFFWCVQSISGSNIGLKSPQIMNSVFPISSIFLNISMKKNWIIHNWAIKIYQCETLIMHSHIKLYKISIIAQYPDSAFPTKIILFLHLNSVFKMDFSLVLVTRIESSIQKFVQSFIAIHPHEIFRFLEHTCIIQI